MKRVLTAITLILLFIFSSCNAEETDKNSDTTKTEVVDTTKINDSDEILGQEHTAKFICPNHCKGSGGDEAGVCPVCGMDYIENFDYKE